MQGVQGVAGLVAEQFADSAKQASEEQQQRARERQEQATPTPSVPPR